MTTVRIPGRDFPCVGGALFRPLPYGIRRWVLRYVNDDHQGPTVFYFHPWEIDSAQLRPGGVPLKTWSCHYVNLSRIEIRLFRILSDLQWDRVLPATSRVEA